MKQKCSECGKSKLTWYGGVLQCDNCGHTEATRNYIPPKYAPKPATAKTPKVIKS